MNHPKDAEGGVYGQAAMRGQVRICLATALLDAEVVRSLLDPKMKLVRPPGPVPPPGKHPVVLEFNHQIRVKDLLGIDHTYFEMIVNVPGVLVDTPIWRLKSRIFSKFGRQDSLNFMTVLYLDDTAAVVGGRLVWGFNKKKAKFEVRQDDSAEDWAISRRRVLCRSKFRREGHGRKAVETPNFVVLEPIFNSRTVTRVPLTLLGKSFAFFMTTRYGWEFGDATLHPMRMQIQAEGPSGSGLPRIDLDAPGIDASQWGGFQTFFPWYLTPAAPMWAPLRWLMGAFWRLFFWLRGLF